MKISVVIPAHNTEATINTTINSVLSQTVAPYEILVFDDGSTDNTALILESYKPHVTVFKQSNKGVAHARNYLCERARGDIIAFLDADDIWHPRYLEVQHRIIEQYPKAVAYFTDHENLFGCGTYQWKTDPADILLNSELISPKTFIARYDMTPLRFQMSCCCIYKKVLMKLGKEPFLVSVSGADDTYLHNMLPLLGSVVHTPEPLVAYRITDSSISANQLKMAFSVVEAFKRLDEHYRRNNNSVLRKAFKLVFASRRRGYGKFLMGAGSILDARREFRASIKITGNPVSIAKSLVLLFLSYMPAHLQPKWPSSHRKSKSHDHASMKDKPS